MSIKSINESAAQINITEAPTKLQLFFKYWPLIRIILRYVKVFTNAKTDKIIDETILLGNELENEQ